MFLNIILSIIGFAMLIKCADFFVSGASSFAKNFKIPTLVIGLTVVAFGTSAPELAISFNSHLSGNTDMMFGNVIGSNIANVFMILGLAVVIAPFNIQNDAIRKQIPILLLVTASLSVLFLDGLFYGTVNGLTRADGIILILFFAVFAYYLITLLLQKREKAEAEEKPKYKTLMSTLIMLLGLGGVILGSDLVVNNVAELAKSIGISQKIIAVTIISVGTSLPELATTVIAAKKGENSMAIGNIVGSNIFNIAIVLGLPVIVLGDVTTTAFGTVDIMFLMLSVVVLLAFTITGRELKRYEGVIFIALYCVYAGYVIMQ